MEAKGRELQYSPEVGKLIHKSPTTNMKRELTFNIELMSNIVT